MKELLILGGGTAGTMMANKLVPELADAGWRITVVDQDDVHVYQPGLLFVPFGMYRPDAIVKPRAALLRPEVRYLVDPVAQVDLEAKKVELASGAVLDWDLLVVATGTELRHDETTGLRGPRWHRDAFDFYSFEGASLLAKRLGDFEGGRLVINPVEMPIKCPVAPLEFAFLADWFLTEKGVRDKTEIVFVTPLDGAFTKPVASTALGGMFADRGIELVADFSLERVDDDAGLVSFDGRDVPYDLLVTVPVHGGASFVAGSGLGDAMDFVRIDRHTLQSEVHPDVFGIGDATNAPTSKAGAVAHFMGETLFENVLRHVDGRPLEPGFDGHANCFIETGFGKAMLIDFNYETEPLRGRFPLPGIGPFTLLEESVVNHLGKLAFKWLYWNVMLKGQELPFDHRMLMAGKWS